MEFLFRSQYDTSILQQYHQETETLLKRADLYSQYLFNFIHPWDMERCEPTVLFQGQWDMNPYGDPEWTWMFNRHRFIEELAQAYFLTKNNKYFDTFKYLIEHWIEHNQDIENCLKTSWRRIDAGIRIVHWMKAIEFFQECPLYTDELHQKIIESLHQHGVFLSQHVSNISLTSNWGVLEFQGLFHLSLFHPFKESKDWLQTAKKVLEQTSLYQILDDGIQWERSPMYHNEVLHSYLTVLLVAKRKNISLESDFLKKVYSMALANLKWQKPNYKQICWGDSDDTDLRDIMSLSAYVFEDSHIKFRALEQLNLELYLLLGEIGRNQYNSLNADEPLFKSWYFKDTGFLVMRDSWDRNACFCTLNSKNFAGGHAHSDLLNITFYARGRDYLIDSGRFTYTESLERRELKSSFGHNTIIINSQEPTIYKDPWSNTREAKFINGDWKQGDKAELGIAYNSTYLNQGILITRNILSFSTETSLILDVIQGEKEKLIELKFNSPHAITGQDTHWHLDDLNWIIDPSINMSIKDNYYSLHYNQKNTGQQGIQKKTASGNTSVYNLFTFKIAQVEYLSLIDRKNKPISSQKAFGLKIILDKEEYVLLYKIEPSGQHSGFFLEYDGMFFMHSKVLLKKTLTAYDVLLTYI